MKNIYKVYEMNKRRVTKKKKIKDSAIKENTRFYQFFIKPIIFSKYLLKKIFICKNILFIFFLIMDKFFL